VNKYTINMTKKEINNYVFYQIVCDDCPEYIYIGSTCNFTKRKYKHKSDCNNEQSRTHNLKIYAKIRDNGGWDNWTMVVIDEAKQLTLRESQAHEEKLRLKYEGNLNNRRAFITKEQDTEAKAAYREANKENTAAYYQANKEAIKKRKAAYYQANKEAIKEYNAAYREANKEALNQKRAAYRVANKEVN
jgi:hypothetical protein